MSSYRPREYRESAEHRLPPRPAALEMPVTARERTRYNFRDGDSWRPEDEFSFRNNDDAPRYPQESNDHGPRRSRSYGARERNQRSDQNDYNHSNSQQKRGPWNYNRRGRGRGVATAERPLLRARQGDATEKMFGLADEMNGTLRFLPANDMSDSEEEDMQESGSDLDESGGVSLNKSGPDTPLDSVPGDSIEPPAKRRALGLSKSALDSKANIPRWSNPDPYTSLPPINDEQRKKKDVVKIIRKARVVAEKLAVPQSQVAANDDFISFGFEEESSSTDGDARSRRSPRREVEHGGHGAPGAPSGPRRLHHLNDVQGQDLRSAPGSQVVSISAESMGPPPGLDSLTKVVPGAARSDLDLVQDSALGNRKRNHDDEIKGARRPPRNRKKQHEGSLTEVWVPTPDTDSTPWLNHGSSCQSESAGFR